MRSPNKKIIIHFIGIGGIGCPIAQYLIATGIKHLSLIDDDIVQISNLNRQILFNEKDLGEKKVEVAKEQLRYVNPRNNINIISYYTNTNFYTYVERQ